MVVRRSALISNQYLLRIHCVKNMWKKRIGEVKYYKYFTAARRSVESCDFYEPIGDDNVKEYLKELRKTLPIKEEVYSYVANSSEES